MNPFFLRILKEPWAISPESADTYIDALIKLLDGKLVFEGDATKFAPTMLTGSKSKIIPSAANASGRSGNGVSGSGNVSLIPITTPLMKYDQECGPRGMLTIGSYIKAAAANPQVDGIILYLDTPGGTVAGIQTLGEIIRSVEKPIFAFVSDMAASAGYWLASQCDMIIAENKNTQIGSIGVMMAFQDMKPALEKMGVVFHSIKSNLSEDKNATFEELQKGEYDNYRNQVLDPLAKGFIDTVKSTRGAKITDETIYKGRMEFAENAKAIGLIDDIASLDQTVEMVLSFEKKPVQTNNPKSKMHKYPFMMASLGVTALEADAEGYVALSAEQMAAIEAKMVADNGAATKASEDLTAATKAAETHAAAIAAKDGELKQVAETHTAEIAAKDGELAQIKAEKEAILKGAGAPGAKIVVAKEISASVKHEDLAAVEGMTSDERFAYLKEKGY